MEAPGKAHRYVHAAVILVGVQVDTMLAKAKAKYEQGDRLSAMKLYEDALKEVRPIISPSPVTPGAPQRRGCLPA